MNPMSTAPAPQVTSYTSGTATYKTAQSGNLSITRTSYEGRGPRNLGGKRHCVTVNIKRNTLDRECIATLVTDDAEKARRFANQVWALRHRDLQLWNGTARSAIDPLFKAASR